MEKFPASHVGANRIFRIHSIRGMNRNQRFIPYQAGILALELNMDPVDIAIIPFASGTSIDCMSVVKHI